MMQYKTTAAAREASRIAQLDIKPQTLRNWARVDEFAPFWSDDANPLPGHVRTFNDHDIGVIVAIARLRQGNLSYPEIANRLPEILEERTETEEAEAAEVETDAPEAPGQALQVSSMQYDLTPFVTATNANNARLADVEKRLATVESQRTNVTLAVAMFVAGMLVVAIAVAVALALVR